MSKKQKEGLGLKKSKWLSYLTDGILSGLMIGIGGMVSMSCDNRYIGAFLFSLGLFSIIQLKFGLYTGKVGYIPCRNPAYIGETAMTLLGNGIGTLAAGILLRLVRFYDLPVTGMEQTLSERAHASVTAKMDDSILSMFILAIFCGMLMFAAVELNRKCTESGNHIGALFGTVLPVMVFILCGFNHCIADMFYFFFAGCPAIGKAVVYFPAVILGNALGGMLIPMMKRCSLQKL